MSKRKRGHNRHHVVPVSRGGTAEKGNIIKKPIRMHDAYHLLFGNATPEEAIAIILTEWTTPEWKERFLRDYDNRIERIERMLFPSNFRAGD